MRFVVLVVLLVLNTIFLVLLWTFALSSYVFSYAFVALYSNLIRFSYDFTPLAQLKYALFTTLFVAENKKALQFFTATPFYFLAF